MSSDVISLLQLDKQFLEGRFIIVKEHNGCDSSFISSCLLGQQIKKANFTLLITFHKFLTHYQNVGLKMNYNIKKSVESGILEVYSLEEELVNAVIHGDEYNILNEIGSNIESKILVALEKFGSITVILEGVSHLFDLNFNLQTVNLFLKKLIYIIREQENSLFLLHCNVAGEGDLTCVLANLLSHMSSTMVEVESLQTGRSADVSGHLIIKNIGSKFDFENMHSLDMKTRKYHFKLFDRGVKLFAPGSF